jgi:hypothetical protein
VHNGPLRFIKAIFPSYMSIVQYYYPANDTLFQLPSYASAVGVSHRNGPQRTGGRESNLAPVPHGTSLGFAPQLPSGGLCFTGIPFTVLFY